MISCCAPRLMRSPRYNPLARPRPRRLLCLRNILIALVVGYVGVIVAQSRTIHLEGAGPQGKVEMEVKVRARLNGIGTIMDGGGLLEKRVGEIVVKHEGEPVTWVTRDRDLRIIGDWDRRVTEKGWCRISGGRLYLVMDDRRLNNGTSSMIIGLPDGQQRVTTMAYWGSGNDREYELGWVRE